MFESLQLKNFKSHRNTLLNLSKGINVIIGISDSGKSNIIRNLRWLIENKPKGGNFFSNFVGKEGNSESILTLNNNDIVSLRKNIKRNKKTSKKEVVSGQYKLNNNSYSAQSIPDQVLQALNVSELNFQKQLDIPFLVTSSAGEFGRTINRIIRVEEADEWVAETTTLINSTNKDIKYEKSKIEEVQQEIEKYEDIDQVKKWIGRVESYQELISGNSIEYNQLCEFVTDIERYKKEIEKCEKALEAEQYITEIESISTDDLIQENNLLVDWINTNIEVQELEVQRKKLSKLCIELENIYVEINEIQELGFDLGVEADFINQWFNISNEVIDLETEEGELQDKYKSLLKELGLCPTCFTEVDNKMIERILGEL